MVTRASLIAVDYSDGTTGLGGRILRTFALDQEGKAYSAHTSYFGPWDSNDLRTNAVPLEVAAFDPTPDGNLADAEEISSKLHADRLGQAIPRL